MIPSTFLSSTGKKKMYLFNILGDFIMVSHRFFNFFKFN